MIDVSLWVTVVVLALLAAKMTVPKPPILAWDRFFNVALATIVRGSLEKGGAEFSDWVARMSSLIGAEEDSELFDDPHQLGEDYNVEKGLGRACSWEKVAVWGDEVRSSISSRASELIWVSLGGVSDLLDLKEELPSLKIIDVGGDIASDLSGCLNAASDRLVIFVAGSATEDLAKALRESPLLRDRVKATVSINGKFGEWFDDNFTHEAMDTELARSTPWFSIGINEGEGDCWEPCMWPEPEVPESGRRSIESIFLGSVSVDSQVDDSRLMTNALMITILQRFAQ